jgi:hypothetical protein
MKGEEKAGEGRKIKDQKLIAFRAPFELRSGLEGEAERLTDLDNIRFTNTRGALCPADRDDLIGWIVADYLSRPMSERTARARNGRAILDEKLKSPVAIQFYLGPDVARPELSRPAAFEARKNRDGGGNKSGRQPG